MRNLIRTVLCGLLSYACLLPLHAQHIEAPGVASDADAKPSPTPEAGAEGVAAQTAPLPGETKQSPIEVCKPEGERDYLSKLTCPAGDVPSYRRLGSYGERNPLPKNISRAEFNAILESMMRYDALQPGETDHHVIDGYEFACGAQKRIIYMDMYHCQPHAVSASDEVDATDCKDHPGCLDKMVRYCAGRAKHEKDVYAEVFDRARLTYFLQLVGTEVSSEYKVHCDPD
jgi:hypothetical protein